MFFPRPTKLKGPRKTGKKPSPKKETESVPAEPSPEILLEEGQSQKVTAGDENMNHGGIDAGVTQNDLLTCELNRATVVTASRG